MFSARLKNNKSRGPLFTGLLVILVTLPSTGAPNSGRSTCAAVVTQSQETKPADSQKVEEVLLKRLQGRCQPIRKETLAPILDGIVSSIAGILEARDEISAARTLFLNVHFGPAEEKIRRAISLYDRHHAALDSYREICEAKAFLGVVLLETHRPDEATEEFRSVLAIDPVFSPDPMAVPPPAKRLFDKIQADMLASPRGSLSLKTDPTGADLVFNGKALGTTPLSLKDLLPGKHFLKISRPGYVPWDGVIQIEPNQLTSHEIFLKPTMRLLLLTSNPEQTKSILAEVARALQVNRVILVRVNRLAALDNAPLVVYHSKQDKLEVETTLSGFTAKPSPPLPKPVDVTPPVTEPPIPPPNTDQGDTAKSRSFLSSWWFRTLLGAVVISAAVAIPLLIENDSKLRITVIRGAPNQ